MARFIGLDRTIFQVNSKKGIPKFYTPDSAFTASKTTAFGISNAIELNDNSGQHFIINQETGNPEIRYTKNPYIPIKVYKALLKISINLLQKEELMNYKTVIKMLLTDKFDNILAPCAIVPQYVLSDNFKVHAHLYKNRGNISLPTHIFQLVFENVTLQLFIPFSDLDLHLYRGIPMTPLVCPPIFFGKEPKINKFHFRNVDLRSSEQFSEEVFLKLEMDAETVKDITSLDPKTGMENDTPFNQGKIKKIILSNEDFRLKITDLKNKEDVK